MQSRVLILSGALAVASGNLNLRGPILVLLAFGLEQIHSELLVLLSRVNASVLDFTLILVDSEVLLLPQIGQRVVFLDLGPVFVLKVDFLNVREREVNIRLDPRHIMKGVPVVTLFMKVFILTIWGCLHVRVGDKGCPVNTISYSRVISIRWVICSPRECGRDPLLLTLDKSCVLTELREIFFRISPSGLYHAIQVEVLL
jgi:hypothetical protein